MVKGEDRKPLTDFYFDHLLNVFGQMVDNDWWGILFIDV